MKNRAGKTTGKLFLVVMILLLAILAALSWPHIAGLYWQEIAALSENKEKLAEEITFLKNTMACEENNPSFQKTLSLEKSRLQEAIPDPQDLPQVLSELEELLNSKSITINSMQIGSLDCKEEHCTVKIDLALEGNRFEILRMLENMETFRRLLICEDLTWSSGDGDRSSINLTFRLVFTNPEDKTAETLEEENPEGSDSIVPAI
ncbi:MAG: type 4a pilus biogenesis protein PilO [Bacillota bacterium]|nr:type 4a pilus biogenesis protein PilO [Bacillota bacterium]